MTYNFPKEFAWGTATASYQIEGAVKQDGRGESIWDRFCQMPGHIVNGDTGDVANDHYNLYKEDVELMKGLGHNAYRFSVAWPRVMPSGRGEVNAAGLKFYSDLVDELLAAGIEPYLTIYHWDLPQALQDIGGWQNPDIVGYFADYCKVLYEALGGRVKKWITLNEPFCTAFLGYYSGMHAPGVNDLSSALLVSYHLMLAHGEAVRLFRKMLPDCEIGITLNYTPSYPVGGTPEDEMASRYQNGMGDRWFTDAAFKGGFPADMIGLYKERGLTLPDFADISKACEKLDFLGVNYYNSSGTRYSKESWPLYAEGVKPDAPVTDRGWPITPDALTNLLVYLHREYNVPKIYITENGASYNDVLDMDRKIDDYNRVDYLRRHIIAVNNAMGSGVDIRGYFIWSLYDNFEWAFGRYSRFGIIYHDFDTLERIPKRSAYWYRDVINNNGLD